MTETNNPSYSEIQMQKYNLAYEFVEAIEVDARYVNSLPNAGSPLQRFGEQVEILLPGPAKKKIYAQVGEFIVYFKDANGLETYCILSAPAFKGLFKLVDAELVTAKEPEFVLESPGLVIEKVEEEKPLSAKERKKQEALKKFEGVDIESMEQRLGSEHVKE